MAKNDYKNKKKLCGIGSLGTFALLILGCYVLLMSWQSHHRSHFHTVDVSDTRNRLLAGAPRSCKSVSVACSSKEPDKQVTFALDREKIGPFPVRGVILVAIDPWKQEVIFVKSYDEKVGYADGITSAINSLSAGAVVLVGVLDAGFQRKDNAARAALRALGASMVEDSIPDGYALIGVKGGSAIAESQGTTTHVSGVLPCAQGAPAWSPPDKPTQLENQIDSRHGQEPPADMEENADVKENALDSEETAGDKEPPADMKENADVKENALDSEETADDKATQNPTEGSPETTYRCVGGQGDRSCLFKNLYYHRGRFIMYVLSGPKDRIEVFRADKYEGLWKPDIKEFSDEAAIRKSVQSMVVIEERGLSVQFNPLFHHNIGHALFDGLYPAFLATVKLDVEDKPWRPIVAVDPGCFDEHSPGPLQPGDPIEAYLPHPTYKRTLRTKRCKVVNVPKIPEAAKEESCTWQQGMDHNGLDLGSESVGQHGSGEKKACLKTCALTFGCKAAVLFASICYLKGSGGSLYGKDGRSTCVMPGTGPKATIVVKPDPGQDVDEEEVTIPEPWIVGKIRRRCMSEGIYEMFGGTGEIRRLFELERDGRNYPDLLLRFEEVVIGVGGAGNMVADKTGAIGGSLAPYHAMSKFRDRMLRSYDLPVERGVRPLSPDHELNVVIISNKRFQPQDRTALDDCISKFRQRGNSKVEWIDWGRIGGPHNKFREHLKRTQKADVYISSIGTALQYVPFLRDGKTYIALGSVWMRSGQYFPTFMEQQLAGGGTPYLRTLYADPGGVLRQKLPHTTLGEDGFFAGVNGTLVFELMKQAESLVRKGFNLPVPPEENLSTEARILIDLCKRDASACKKMMENRNGAVHDCALLLWNEAVVYEVGPWRKGKQCGSAHHKLLRQLRKEYGIPGYGAPEA